ncbi:MAG: respiratory nitrate reductase subunit gamma [Bacteroidetes bacterium]|nr:respiratory nitrate reductase subunit gamma [Bacteroidota bacterium]
MLQTVKNPGKLSRAFVWFSLVAFFAMLSTTGISQSGEELFKTNCSPCHKITDEKFVGPGLKGVTEKRSTEWLLAWTKNSQEFIASGDSAANAVFEEFNKSVMTPFDFLGDSAILSIFDYIAAAENAPAETTPVETVAAAETPAVPATVEAADPGAGIIYWFTIIVIIIVAFFIYSTYRNVHKALDENGYLGYKNPNKNYFFTFLIMIGCSVLIIFLLTQALASNTPAFNTLMFGGLPYIALAVFFIGTIFRYKNIGFKVSSLSTQFLEGRALFFGSQPFHWGLLVLFFGHLIAFLIPRAVIFWNGDPLRLVILEVTSLVFALSALIGLILLIKRRFTNRRVMVVTNNMDALVYVVLLIQIVSGISIALFARWGSTWFATSLTPYLRSIFTFDPQVGVANAMPWYAQIHIISAFFIIAIIPFTRFMHFLVAPVSYIWRKYQVVYWNWNRKSIRKSTAHTYGKLPRNH